MRCRALLEGQLLDEADLSSCGTPPQTATADGGPDCEGWEAQYGAKVKGVREEDGADGGMMTGWWLLEGGRIGILANLQDCSAAILT